MCRNGVPRHVVLLEMLFLALLKKIRYGTTRVNIYTRLHDTTRPTSTYVPSACRQGTARLYITKHNTHTIEKINNFDFKDNQNIHRTCHKKEAVSTQDEEKNT